MDHSDFKIAWICALPLELAAAESMLDQELPPLPQKPGDFNTYRYGRVAGHNIVIACQPSGSVGLVSAAGVAESIRRSFGEFKIGLMVGIGGGVPSTGDIRLGDVVVSKPSATFGGVVQYDLGKAINDREFLRTGFLNRPSNTLLTAISALEAKHVRHGSDIQYHLDQMVQKFPRMFPHYSHQGVENDLLYNPDFEHVRNSTDSCRDCGFKRLVHRANRATTDPMIHYGVVASGNELIRHARTRDRIAQDLNALCFEMEAAGLMNGFPCLVIRGIADYADSHKNKRWQGYAAATAAAFTKELLQTIPAEPVSLPSAYPGRSWSYSGYSPSETATIQSHRKSSAGFSASSRRKGYFKTPYPSSKNFIGREDYLRRIGMSLTFSEGDDDDCKCVALYGLPGSGKTQTAIKFAELHRSAYTAVLFINSSSDEDIINDFDKVHDLLELETSKETERFNQVGRWLSDESNSPWLIVFDSANLETTNLSEYFPRGSGHVIITSHDSRVQDLDPVIDALQFDNMSVEESRRLLITRSGRKTVSAAESSAVDEIAEQLGHLPLALDSAAAQIRHQKMSFSSYLSTFLEKQENSRQLLRYRPRMSSYDKAIYTCLDSNFDILMDESSPAMALLILFAHLDGSSIQFDLLDRGVEAQWRVGKDGELFHQTPEQGCVDLTILDLLRNKIEFGRAIERLMSLSLVYQQDSASDDLSRSVSVHRLVQMHIQSRLTPVQQENGTLCAVSLVAQAFPLAFRLEEFSRAKPFVMSSFDEYRKLKYTFLPHARACCQNLTKLVQRRPTEDSLSFKLRSSSTESSNMLEIIVTLLSEASMVKMRHYGQDSKTSEWCKRFLELIDTLIEEEDDEYARILRIQNLITFNYGSGSYEKGTGTAMAFLRQHYGEFINQKESKMPISTVPLFNAELYQILVCLAEDLVTETNAKAQYELSHRLLSLCLAVNPQAPSTAEKIALQLRDRVKGKIYKDEGRWKEAAGSLASYCKNCVHGLMDEGWATADQAQCLLEVNDNEEAEAVIQRLLTMRSQDKKFRSDRPLADGENDHNLLKINLAECHLRQGKLLMAESEFEKILQYMLDTEIPPHYYTTRIFSIYCGLARISHLQCDWKIAQERWETAVDYGATVSPDNVPWGRDHFYVSVAVLSLADVLYELEQEEEALVLKRELDVRGIFDEKNRMYWMIGIGSYWLEEMLRKWSTREKNRRASAWLLA